MNQPHAQFTDAFAALLPTLTPEQKQHTIQMLQAFHRLATDHAALVQKIVKVHEIVRVQ